MKIRRILCPTDFSEFSPRALEQAVAFARWYGAELTVLHVYPFMAVLSADAPYFPSGLPLDADRRARLSSELETAAEPARAAGLKPRLLILEGDPAEEILRRARGAHADLVVMGTHGRRGFDRWVLGSVAGRVAHKAQCAVLTVPQPERPRPVASPLYERIVCPVDLAGAEPALEAALSIAAVSKARLTVLHVLEDLAQHEATARKAGIGWGDFVERLERDARQQLRQAVESQRAERGPVDELVASGKPYREILKAADAKDVGLIVMGVHGHNALERMFVGSTTLHVLRQARCAVLTVRAPGERPQA